MDVKMRRLFFCVILTVVFQLGQSASTIDIINLPTSISVKENQNVDQCILSLNISSSTGERPSCTVAHTLFEVIGGPSGDEHCLSTSGPLEEDRYILTVSCTNCDNITDTGTVIVSVLRNNPPTVRPEYSKTVDVSTATPGATIYTVMATDPDNDNLTYSFVSPVPGFSIDSNTGNIITVKDLRSSDDPTVVMNIKVSDGSPADDVTTKLTLTMINFPKKPVITNAQPLRFPENTASGTEIFKCLPQDTTVYYSAVFTPPTANSILDFDTATCAITIKDGQQFDFETQPNYSIKITVNNGFKSNEFTIPLSIIDENDPPKFTNRLYTESQEEGEMGTITFIPAFEASDPENDPLSYEIVNSSMPGMFSIQNQLTGEISNTVAIDYETLTAAGNPISLIIRVRDATSGEDTATVLVRITDKNDETPKFASSTNYFNISKSTPVGSRLLTVKAIDKDSPPNAVITYSLKSEIPDAAGHFNVLENGDVFLKKSVTVPYNGNIWATIMAMDQGGLSSTITIKGVWVRNYGNAVVILRSFWEQTALFTIVWWLIENM